MKDFIKTALIAIAAMFATTFGALAASENCELSRSTVHSLSSAYYGQMVVRCGSQVVATRADLDAQGVDIFDAAAVQAAVGGNLPLRSNGSNAITVVTKMGPVEVVVEDTGHDARW